MKLVSLLEITQFSPQTYTPNGRKNQLTVENYN